MASPGPCPTCDHDLMLRPWRLGPVGKWDAVAERSGARAAGVHCKQIACQHRQLPGEGQSTGLILYCKDGQGWHCGTRRVRPQRLSWVIAWSWLWLTPLLLQPFPPLHGTRSCFTPCVPSDAPTPCPWEGPGVQARGGQA